MADRLTIRAAQPEDAAALSEVEASCFPDPWREADFVQLLAAPGIEGWLCLEGSRVSGYVISRFAAGEGEILNLAVAPEFRRRHAASTLLSHGLESLSRQGVSQVFLEVRRSNRAALSLYRRLEFALAGVRPGYYRKPLEDAMVLYRRLVSSDDNDTLDGQTG